MQKLKRSLDLCTILFIIKLGPFLLKNSIYFKFLTEFIAWLMDQTKGYYVN